MSATDVRCERVASLVPDDAAFARIYGTLPDWRRRKCDAFRFAADKFRSAAVWILLREMLAARGVDADALPVAENEFGKPAFDPSCGLHFSLSHSGERVMAAVSDRPVGCDVEKVGRVGSEVFEACLTAEERAFCAAIPSETERARTFCRLWTRKESYSKAIGVGLSADFASFSVLSDEGSLNGEFKDFDWSDGYIGSVFVSRASR